jgi:hypothetical protein
MRPRKEDKMLLAVCICGCVIKLKLKMNKYILWTAIFAGMEAGGESLAR